MAGTVPNPKKIMNNMPEKILPAAIEPAAAIYTKPHGNKPFSTPIKNNELDFFD